uniref:Uncharacterized protein n=1 Tax=viral metagenome TaxID=1070528 RepID=A0A6M3J153_9ZZZZ
MSIPESKKDTMDWQMVAGLDGDGEAQELTFEDDKIKVSISGDSLAASIENYMRQSTEALEEMVIQLKVISAILTMVTEINISEEDV